MKTLPYNLFRSIAVATLLWAVVPALSICQTDSQSPTGGTLPSVRSPMDQMYNSYKELLPLVHDDQSFDDPANEELIKGYLTSLKGGAQHAEEILRSGSLEPGFVTTLKSLSDLISDAEARFGEGKKEYARWRLRSISNYCIACHTRFNDEKRFVDPESPPSKLPILVQGELLLASRQFDAAKKLFLEAAQDPKTKAQERIVALRRWLLITIRAEPNPDEALSTLVTLREQVAFAPYEKEEILDWIYGIRRWKNEKKDKLSPVAKAKSLIKTALSGRDLLSGNRFTIELLRASALLHAELAKSYGKPIKESETGKTLYLLGLTYRELPLFSGEGQATLILERCIRDFPGSPEAVKSYSLYREIITEQYSGSGGTDIPKDVQRKLTELQELSKKSSVALPANVSKK